MWEYEYDDENDQTTIYWNDDKQATVNGQIEQWENGYPATNEARDAIGEIIQEAGTPDRIRMQYDFNYGFQERRNEQ